MKTKFLEKSATNTLVVGIIGLGYVGLPLAEAYVRKGVQVIGYDISESRVEDLKKGLSGMKHITDARVQVMLDKELFTATVNAADLKTADALLICVPTPLDIHSQPDLSYVESTCHTIKAHIRPGQIIILESTTYPGTTTDVMLPILEESGLKAGKDFALAYSPEREDPGNPEFDTSTIPKVVGADSEGELEMALAVYRSIVTTVSVSNTRTAEATKLVENIFRWVNIAMVNELKGIFEPMGIDVWEVIDAAATKPFGFMPFYPGPGVGGHCIRIDPYYLSWKAREYGISTQFIELAGEINTSMPKKIVNRLLEELSLREHKALAGSKILLCGIAYKSDIDDMRESPSLELMGLLQKHGAIVEYADSYIPEIPETREHPEFAGRKSTPWTEKNLETFDAAIIATSHSNVDYELLVQNVSLTLDTRNATSKIFKGYEDKIVKC